ncbi:MAG: thioredoxin family protein [Chloroflexota bacterium]|nr:thioredoxin family protein [Anaerolineales bacterium]
MTRLAYFISLFAVLMLACGIFSTPVVVNTATPLQEIATPFSKSEETTIPAEETGAEEAQLPETLDLPELQNSALVDFYDPAREPAEDLKQAILIAQHENKRIILELGGDWCIWCKHMDDFYAAHSDLLQFRAEHYVLVKVNVSEENMNETFLSQFPEAAGYPHIYILDRDGTLLHSQNTGDLEDGADSYVLDVFMAFLQKWALPAR